MSTSSQGSIPITDDEVFRRKLLMDGEGMGDDRRLNYLLRNFYTYCDIKDQTEEQIVSGCEGLLSALENCEFLMSKSQQAQVANDFEIQNYEKLETHIEKNLAEVEEVIVRKKAELVQAKKIREQKQQYDALAKGIMVQPDRKETQAKLLAINEEIAALSKSKEDLENKFKRRHNDLGVFLSAVAVLKKLIAGQESDSE